MICDRGHDHDALKRDAAKWAALEVVGVMVLRGGSLELRNCECDSTLALRIDETASQAEVVS